MTTAPAAPRGVQPRNVGLLLGIGILLMPYVFAWFLLKSGYSTRSRIVAFGWMGTIVLVAATQHNASLSPASSVTPGTASSPSSGPATAQAEFDRVNTSFTAAIASCEARAAVVQGYLHHLDRYGGYDAAVEAKQACMGAWTGASAKKFGDAIPQPTRSKLNDDLDACSNAYLTKATAFDGVASVLNGDARPSTVRQAEYEIGHASSAVSECVTTYVADAKAAGFKLPGDKATAQKKRRSNSEKARQD
jgi:hypothetical protein